MKRGGACDTIRGHTVRCRDAVRRTFYAEVERDAVIIHLQAATETKRQPGQGAVNIFVTDVDALYQELKSRGARTLNEPKDYPYGMRDFNINDIDGNQLCFGMESKQQ